MDVATLCVVWTVERVGRACKRSEMSGARFHVWWDGKCSDAVDIYRKFVCALSVRWHSRKTENILWCFVHISSALIPFSNKFWAFSLSFHGDGATLVWFMQYYTTNEPQGPWTWMWASLQIREKVKMPPHVIELAGEGSRRALEFDLSAQFPSLRWRKKYVVFFSSSLLFCRLFWVFLRRSCWVLSADVCWLRLEAWNSFSMFQSDFSLVWTVDKTTPKSRYCLAWRKLALTWNYCRVLIKSELYSPVAARYNFTLESCWTFWWLINFCRVVREKNSSTFFEI